MNGTTPDHLSESHRDLPIVVEKDTGITRRWIDKALVGAVIAITALVGIIYGTIVRTVDDATKKEDDHEHRITTTETEINAIHSDLKEIKADVKGILREIKR